MALYIEEKSGKIEKLTWQKVVHSNNFPKGKSIDGFVWLVDNLGYSWFVWNNHIYKALGNGKFLYTGIYSGELDEE